VRRQETIVFVVLKEPEKPLDERDEPLILD
jgi:hypothetical protein